MIKRAKVPRVRALSLAQITTGKRSYLCAFQTIPGCQVTDALDIAGITLGELEKWRHEDETFAMLERQLKDQKGDDTLRSQIEAYILRGDKDIIRAAMKRLPEFNPARKTELAINGNVTHHHLANKTSDELDAIIRAGLAIECEFEPVEKKEAIGYDDETDQANTETD
jgi:hypothetical protein